MLAPPRRARHKALRVRESGKRCTTVGYIGIDFACGLPTMMRIRKLHPSAGHATKRNHALAWEALNDTPKSRRHQIRRRSLARASLRRMEGYLRHPPYVDANRWQNPPRTYADGESLVGSSPLRFLARSHHIADPVRTRQFRNRVRLYRAFAPHRDHGRRH